MEVTVNGQKFDVTPTKPLVIHAESIISQTAAEWHSASGDKYILKISKEGKLVTNK